MSQSGHQAGVESVPGAASPPAARARQGMGDVLILATVLIALAVVGGMLILAFRRRLLSRDRSSFHAGIAESLRDLHSRGILSTEEYDRVRRSMARSAGKSRGGEGRIQPPKSG
jgi:hypothetical protein